MRSSRWIASTSWPTISWGRSRDAILKEIALLPKGTWHNEMVIDGYNEAADAARAVTISHEGIHVDFAGSAGESPKGIMCPSHMQPRIPASELAAPSRAESPTIPVH